MKILTATISHESNTFSNIATDLEQFRRDRFLMGNEALKQLQGTNTVFGGFLEAAAACGFELIPIMYASATPAGKVTTDAYQTLLAMLLQGLKKHGPADGILLHLHGAMVSDDHDDAEGDILKQVRQWAGAHLPIVIVVDLHANISRTMIEQPTVLIGYDSYPHVDMAERGKEAGELLVRIIKKEVTPVVAMVKPPMLPTSQNMVTDQEPMKTLLTLAHQAESNPRILNVTVAGGFPPADIFDAGFSVVVTADGDLALARETAETIARQAWEMKAGFLSNPVSPQEAVAEAMRQPEGPITVVDIADNPYTGGPGDGPELVRMLVEMGAKNSAFASIADPEVVRAAIGAGVGSRISVLLGGKTDQLHGKPFMLKDAYIKTITDGVFVNRGPMNTNVVSEIGKTVLLVCGEVSIIVAEKRISPTDLEIFRFIGIEPTRKFIIGLKGKGHFRASFEPISKRVILSEGPGITGSQLQRLKHAKVRRPIFPLDADASYEQALRFQVQPIG